MSSANTTTASTTIVLGSGDSPVATRTKRPKYSKFTQQELPACKPILTPRWVISAFMLVAIVFIPIGVAALFASRDVVEVIYRYDTDCIPTASRNNKVGFIQSDANKSCSQEIQIPKDMNQPIYVYYQLDNFYQNHRRYVKSRSDNQLRDNSSYSDVSSCEPEDYVNGVPIVPCGLIAWSTFNDTYTFSRSSSSLTVNKKNIAWKSDRESKFGKNVYPSENFNNRTLIGGKKLNTSIPLSDQEDLIVWMRTAALPSFRKLYGKIEVDLTANETISVAIDNNYNTYSFDGKKKIVLSTASWLGGKNDFLGLAYLVVGGLCFFLAMVFTIVYLFKPRRLGDPSYLSWNRNPAGH